MISSSVRRLRNAAVVLTLTAAAASTAVVAASPASATAATCTTTTSVSEGGKNASHVHTWGDWEAVHVDVVAHCTGGSYNPTVPLAGTTTLYKSYDNGQHWTPVASASGSSSSYISRYGTNWITRTTVYGASYSGGTDSSGDRFAASQDTIVIGMIRNTKEIRSRCGSRGCRDTFKVTPVASIKGMKVIIQKKRSGSWHWWKTLRADRYGKFTVTFPVGNYRFQLPHGRGFLKSRTGVLKVYRYRAATRSVLH